MDNNQHPDSGDGKMLLHHISGGRFQDNHGNSFSMRHLWDPVKMDYQCSIIADIKDLGEREFIIEMPASSVLEELLQKIEDKVKELKNV